MTLHEQVGVESVQSDRIQSAQLHPADVGRDVEPKVPFVGVPRRFTNRGPDRFQPLREVLRDGLAVRVDVSALVTIDEQSPSGLLGRLLVVVAGVPFAVPLPGDRIGITFDDDEVTGFPS